MSNVVGYIRSRSVHRRTRSAMENRHAQVYDGTFTRSRAQSLRQQALAEEEDNLVVSSPKDKNFESIPWEALRERTSNDFFSTSTTPDSDVPRTPDSTEHRQFYKLPEHPPSTTHGHRRTKSTPVTDHQHSASASAGQKPSHLTKRRVIPMSKSEPSPQTGTFPTIRELSDTLSKTHIEKPLPPSPKSARPPPPTRQPQHRSTRSVDILDHNRKLQAQLGITLPYSQPPTANPQRPPSSKAGKPTHIDLPLPNRLPSELHVHTPEYTEALREWFPAMAQKDPLRRDKKYASLNVITRDIGVYS
jgi:hypothetical protein